MGKWIQSHNAFFMVTFMREVWSPSPTSFWKQILQIRVFLNQRWNIIVKDRLRGQQFVSEAPNHHSGHKFESSFVKRHVKVHFNRCIIHLEEVLLPPKFSFRVFGSRKHAIV
ncbi:hypothetical protein PVK06_021120 [Gossypium arboreum]|uniref:Uncharacterized protein n=1 Tax=Gossypium arboreum TaxID=29729 RepID=A0ABR0PP50_GOSAR|nr:hypothetical protein PVK06_021120 [Gossypium arboreum]